jgi:hypothetical protein
VTGLQIVLTIDGKPVGFTMQNQEKIDGMMADPGSLGNVLRGFRDAYLPLISGETESRMIDVRGGELGPINLIHLPPGSKL